MPSRYSASLGQCPPNTPRARAVIDRKEKCLNHQEREEEKTPTEKQNVEERDSLTLFPLLPTVTSIIHVEVSGNRLET